MQTDTGHIAYLNLCPLTCPSCDEVLEPRQLNRRRAVLPLMECPKCFVAFLPRRMKQTIEISVR